MSVMVFLGLQILIIGGSGFIGFISGLSFAVERKNRDTLALQKLSTGGKS